MDVLGIIFLVIVALVVIGAIIAVLMSMPDIRRYLRIRKM